MKTVQVRIAVVVNEEGEWAASGWGHAEAGLGPEEGIVMDAALELLNQGPEERRFWLTAELPLPTTAELTATVEEAK